MNPTDAEIEAAILEALKGPLAGEKSNTHLRENVCLALHNYRLQVRRVARVASEMADKGLIKFRMVPGHFCDKVLYSAVRT